MRNPDFNPTTESNELSSKLEILKRFPRLGIDFQVVSIERAIELFNSLNLNVAQFKPKTVEEVKRLSDEINETKTSISLHVPAPEFLESTGNIVNKEELVRMLEEAKIFDLVTIHLNWKDANTLLDEDGNWRNTELANNIIKELASLFMVGIKNFKTMAIENIRHKPTRHGLVEPLGSRPEHLIKIRGKISEILAKELNLPIQDVMSKIGYTLDVGHIAGNANLSKEYPLEKWLDALGQDIKFMHIHDVKPVIKDNQEIEKAHVPLGTGVIDWKSFFKLKRERYPDIPAVLELNKENIIKSTEYLSTLN